MAIVDSTTLTGADVVGRLAAVAALGFGIALPLVVLLAYALVPPYSHHFLVAVAATAVYLPLHVRHVRYALRGVRPRGLPWTLLLMAAAIVAPTSRSTLAEVRRLIGRYKMVSSRVELETAASLLPAAGMDVRVEVRDDALPAEDMHMIRGALVALLSREPDMEVVAEIDRGDEVLEAAVRTRPDVAVLDIDLPGVDGLSAAEMLHASVPSCQLLVLTGLSQPGHLLRALKVHVRGFLLKEAPAPTLAQGVRSVAAGQRVIDSELLAAALDTGEIPLTARGADVLRAAETGISTDEIGRRLFLAPSTVRNYLSNAIAKVGGHNRIEAIRIARDAGWL